LRKYLKGSGGPPRVFSPLPPQNWQRSPRDLPVLLILPGIDGTGYTAAAQFPSLSERFDLKSFFIPVEDRTPIEGLVKILRDYIEEEVSQSPDSRPIYVLGESFGGILALLLADSCGHLCLNRVVLVNPATSFQSSIWSSALGDLLPQLPAQAYDVVPYAISPFLGNPLSLARTRVSGEDPSLASQAVQTIAGLFELVPVLDNLKEILPQETLQWKLKLLQEGSDLVTDSLLNRLEHRVLVIVGDADLLIPSEEESERLKRNLRLCSVKVVEGAGHALMQEADISISDIFDEMGFYTPTLKYTSPKPIKRIMSEQKVMNGHSKHLNQRQRQWQWKLQLQEKKWKWTR
jgi:pimeloyl-ACP methyl ester carboxylesterase